MRTSSSLIAASIIALAAAQSAETSDHGVVATSTTVNKAASQTTATNTQTTTGSQTTSSSGGNPSAQAGSEILALVTSVQSGAAFSSIAVVRDGEWNSVSASAADTALAQLVFNGGTATTSFFASIPTDAAIQTFYKSVAEQEMAIMSKYSLLPSQKTSTSTAATTTSTTGTSDTGNGTASSTGGGTGSGSSDGIIGSGGSGMAGKYEREQQPLFKKLKLLLLFNPFTEWLDRSHFLRLWIYEKTVVAGQREASRASSYQIKTFVDFYHINMEEFQPLELKEYATFEESFVRQYAVGGRPIFAESDPTKVVVVYPSVSQAQALEIKGDNFTIENLILDPERATVWANGGVASFQLSPQDYHRYHSPVAGKVSWFKQISGDYYQVYPICLSSNVDILTRNARCCIGIETKEFGMVLFVAIGATNVGTVEYV